MGLHVSDSDKGKGREAGKDNGKKDKGPIVEHA